MKFDYDILKEFIPSEHIKEYVFENVFTNMDGDIILAPYRYLIWSYDLKIPLTDYLNKVKQKERDTKLGKIL
jgi:hypothetical protein